MTEPNEEIVTFDGDWLVRHETVEGAEDFAEDVSTLPDTEVFIQVVESDDLNDGDYLTFRNE